MGKKVNQEIRKTFNFKGGENFNRMNYLFKLGNEIYNTNNLLSKVYISMMKDISKRNALKIDKKMKKIICSQCNNLLYKDQSTKIELKNEAGKHTAEMTCDHCKIISKVIIF